MCIKPQNNTNIPPPPKKSWKEVCVLVIVKSNVLNYLNLKMKIKKQSLTESHLHRRLKCKAEFNIPVNSRPAMGKKFLTLCRTNFTIVRCRRAQLYKKYRFSCVKTTLRQLSAEYFFAFYQIHRLEKQCRWFTEVYQTHRESYLYIYYAT